MNESFAKTEIPSNTFRDYLLAVVPHMQRTAGEYERVGRFDSITAVKELRLITVDAGRQTGKTTGVKQFALTHAKNTGQQILHLDWYTKEANYARSNGKDEPFVFSPSNISSRIDPKKIIDHFLNHKYVVLILTGSLMWHAAVVDELCVRYRNEPREFDQNFIVILDK